MLVADSYLGHREEPSIAARLSTAEPERVVLSDADRRRSRVRTRSVDGRELGIVVGRILDDGDVLEAGDGRLVVVELASVTALVVEFADADVSPTDALELGHALGNRHRDLAVRDGEALVPVADSRERTEATVENLLPEGVTTRFEDVPPTTFDGGTPDHDHDHDHGDDDEENEHAGGSSHVHGHDRDHGYDHDHEIHTLGEGEDG